MKRVRSSFARYLTPFAQMCKPSIINLGQPNLHSAFHFLDHRQSTQIHHPSQFYLKIWDIYSTFLKDPNKRSPIFSSSASAWRTNPAHGFFLPKSSVIILQTISLSIRSFSTSIRIINQQSVAKVEDNAVIF